MKAKNIKMLASLMVVCSLFVLVLCAQASKHNSSSCCFTILHTNDLHAHDLSFRERGRLVGGMAKIAHVIETIKHSTANVVVVDAGDFFQGTVLFQRYSGEVEVNLLNQAGYDIVALGNHEFDNGIDNLAKQLKLAKFAVISCNLDRSQQKDLNEIVKDSVVKTINGEKVAFIGVITPDLAQLALRLAPVKMKSDRENWIKPIASQVDFYKNAGVNKIILVSHCGLEADKQLAKALPDVDVIVGGHSHTRLDSPFWIEHDDGSKTAIVQTGSYGRAIGKLALAFDKEGKVSDADYKLINIIEHTSEDQAVSAYLQEKNAPLQALSKEILGSAKSEFTNHFKSMSCDSAIGDLICDALLEEGKDYGAKIAFQNRGGIRGCIDPGPINEEKVQEILPFDNKIVLATISGENLLEVLEHSLAGPLGGSFLDVAGLKIAFDAQKPKGKRIVFVLTENEQGKWIPLEPHKQYKIATNDFTFKGGEGYQFLHASNVNCRPTLLSLAFHNYLLRHKNIACAQSERICPVVANLLEAAHTSEPTLIVHLSEPSTKVTLMFAKQLGASTTTMGGKIPVIVPLEKPDQSITVRQSTRTDVMTIKLSQFKLDLKNTYVVAVCHLRKLSNGRSEQVSYPIYLNN